MPVYLTTISTNANVISDTVSDTHVQPKAVNTDSNILLGNSSFYYSNNTYIIPVSISFPILFSI